MCGCIYSEQWISYGKQYINKIIYQVFDVYMWLWMSHNLKYIMYIYKPIVYTVSVQHINKLLFFLTRILFQTFSVLRISTYEV